jgi:hypothetical protein
VCNSALDDRMVSRPIWGTVGKICAALSRKNCIHDKYRPPESGTFHGFSSEHTEVGPTRIPFIHHSFLACSDRLGYQEPHGDPGARAGTGLSQRKCAKEIGLPCPLVADNLSPLGDIPGKIR